MPRIRSNRSAAKLLIAVGSVGAFAAAFALFAQSGDAGVEVPHRTLSGSVTEMVRGQLLIADANVSGAQSVQFSLAGEHRLDPHPPFSVSFDTDDLQPGSYPIETLAMFGDHSASGSSGEVRIFPIAKVPEFRVSALIVAGTSRMVGLFVANVRKGSVVRAWFPTSVIDDKRIPLELRETRGTTRTYAFANGFLLDAEENSMLSVEVAPMPLAMSHGAEVQGRLAILWLRRNARGVTLAHQSEHSYCTVLRGRSQRSSFQPLRHGDCLTAPSNPAASITLSG